MQVILLERVPKLGQMGEIVSVRDGFARNYLIPQKKALRATESARKDFEKRRAQLEANNLERKQEAQSAAVKVDGQSVTILRQAGESQQLYGSVSGRDISEAFTAAGITLDRQQIVLEHPIKSLGIHEVRVALHPEVEVTVKVNVARSEEEADIQAGKLPPLLEGDDVALEDLDI
jgi:large subunit ribosomal protein L9